MSTRQNLMVLFLMALTLFTSAVRAQDVYKTETIIGIGATLKKLPDGAVEITRLVPNAPAELAGLIIGDCILQVKSLPNSEEVNVINLPLADVVALIRGPIGVPVEILLKRSSGGGNTEGKVKSINEGKTEINAESIVVSIVRDKFEISEDE